MDIIARLTGFIRTLPPGQQAYFIILTGLLMQYSLNLLVYFQLLPDVAGKSLNGIAKNTAYIIPGIIAVAAAVFFSGKKGLIHIVRPYLFFPLNPFWWLFPPVVLILTLWATIALNDILYQREVIFHAVNFPSWADIKRDAPLYIQVALCDELFWIGIIYPRFLAAGYSSLKASLIMGIFWGAEYLPFIFTDFFVAPGLSGSSLVLGWFALTPIYIWLYHKTGSAIIIVFFNLCMQFSYNSLPVLPNFVGDNSAVAMANLLTLIVGVGCWYFYPKGKQ